MQSSLPTLLRQSAALRRACYPSHFVRTVTTSKTPSPNPPQNSSPDDKDNLFHPDNLKDLSPLEIARLRVTYGLIKEHVQALDKNTPPLDPDQNPMIDPKSFEIRKLPRLPPQLLTHFRKQLPAQVAAESRPVSTKGVWEKLSEGDTHLGPELQGDTGAEWAVVDERTMESRQFLRMQRHSLTAPKTAGPKSDVSVVMHMKKKKKICPLKDERGRVNVDFRAVATLSSYLSDNAKILPRRRSGLSAKAQRKVARAVKTARTMALLDPEPKPRITVAELRALERSLN